ncbi:NUDIX domain-containing protein [uncultured Maritalea sp.]|uniref:NUDIX hydrolase n=1 Tax=uncultured Maritalea sp. TaxID=757249 RepID=UPI002604F44A|nr:NUDIX domain-containing protein [uncultured Maritalea sp.]
MAEFFDNLKDAPPINQPLAQGSVSMVFLGDSVLMEKRSDNGQWSFPGGRAEPGEAPEVCAARELEEETGLAGLTLEFVTLFDNPGSIGAYDDGNVVQTHMSVFAAELTQMPALHISEESTQLKFISLAELRQIDLAASHNPIRKLATDLFSKAAT